MRILLLAQFFPPDIGGEERHVLNLSTVLAARGHDVAVATQVTPGTDRFEVLPSGVRVHRFQSTAMKLPGLHSDAGRPHHAPLPDPLVVRALRHIVDTENPQLLHAHNWIVNSAVALRRSRSGHRRFGIVLTLHDYSHVCATQRMMRDGRPCHGPSATGCVPCAARHYGPLVGGATLAATAAMRPWKNHALDHIVCVSRAVAQGNRVERLPTPTSVIPNFVPDELPIPPGAAERHGLPDPGFLLFVGDLSAEKGLSTLLNAYRLLGFDRPPLLLIGRRHDDTPGVLPDGVRLLTDLPHDGVLEAMRRCAAAVLPSIWPDPCPTTVLEAMASGRPVITTSIGGMLDMVEDGVSGLLVPPSDEAALTRAMARVLADQGLAERLGRGGRERVGAFRASSVVDRLETVYRRALPRTPE
jgi:glycosyltransferase involved in cell wall biosynthesis